MVWAANLHVWFRQWVGRHYIQVDPLIWYLRRHQTFIRWSNLRKWSDCPRLDIFDEAEGFGLRDGFAFAISLGQERIAALGLGMERYELGPEDEVALHLAATYFSTRLSKLLDHPPRTNKPLTDRQRECLQWIAVGKTEWETSQILGISLATVKQHIKAAVIKLNAVTRIHAVAIAISTNQIHL
jgi:LuxR family quorum sensing-dependent transcriptional regulator